MKDVAAATHRRDLITNIGKAFIALIGVIAVVGVGYNVWNHFSEKKELEAQSALFKAEQTYEKTLMDAQKKSEPTADAKDPKKAAKVEPVKPADVDFTTSIELYKKVISEHPSSDAALLAAHGLSSIYVEKKQYQEALDTIKKVSTSKKDGLVFVLTELKLSGLYEKVGQCEESVKILSSISSDKAYSYLKPEVLLKTGLCYEKLGQLDKAKETYSTIARDFTNSSSAQEAEKYLKLLALAEKK